MGSQGPEGQPVGTEGKIVSGVTAVGTEGLLTCPGSRKMDYPILKVVYVPRPTPRPRGVREGSPCP